MTLKWQRKDFAQNWKEHTSFIPRKWNLWQHKTPCNSERCDRKTPDIKNTLLGDPKLFKLDRRLTEAVPFVETKESIRTTNTLVFSYSVLLVLYLCVFYKGNEAQFEQSVFTSPLQLGGGATSPPNYLETKPSPQIWGFGMKILNTSHTLPFETVSKYVFATVSREKSDHTNIDLRPRTE